MPDSVKKDKLKKIFRTIIGIATIILVIKAMVSLTNLYLDKTRIAREDELIDTLNKYTLEDYGPTDQEKEYIDSITVEAKRTVKPYDYKTARVIDVDVNVDFTAEFDKVSPQYMAPYLAKLNSHITEDLTAIRDAGSLGGYFKKGVNNNFKCEGEESYYCFIIHPKYSSDSKEYEVTELSMTIELSISDKKGDRWDKYRYDYDYQHNMTAFVKMDSSWDSNTEKKRQEAAEEARKKEEAEKAAASEKESQRYSSATKKKKKKKKKDTYGVYDYADAQSFADDKYEEFYDYEDDYEDEDEAYDAAEDYWYANH